MKVRTTGGGEQKVDLYGSSYALLVAVSEYDNGWSKLESVPREMDQLEKLLAAKGFSVTRVNNPDGDELEDAYEDFIADYGYTSSNRLLFFYSGHGHTRLDGSKGYLVPVDAPDPDRQEHLFLRRALPMTRILGWARDIEAKHALFLFDSCFSGTVFKQKNRPKPSKFITSLATKPVRQFITAGSANEAVPAESTFTPSFIDAIQYGTADRNQDGYVTGTELGSFLQEEVRKYTEQSPQYGKISDYKYSRGDFIFLAGGNPDEGVSDEPIKHIDQPVFGILKVTSEPSGALVKVDSRTAGRTPALLEDITPGTVRVVVEKNGYESEEQRLTVKAGRKAVANFYLQEEPKTGKLTVQTSPQNAKIRFLDIGTKYRSGMELDAGRYHIEVSASGYKAEKRWIDIGVGGNTIVDLRLEKITSRPSTEANFTGEAVGSMPKDLVGKKMDSFDKDKLNYVYEFVRSGEATTWRNPKNGNRYQVIPEPAFAHSGKSERPCRRAKINAVINGKNEKTYATACRRLSEAKWEMQY